MLFQKGEEEEGCSEGNSALIWLDLAKIPNRGWSAVLVVSEQLTLSLYHGNNLLLKPRKQINYGKDISRCHYGVIRKNISIQHAGRSCWQKGAVCMCVYVCVSMYEYTSVIMSFIFKHPCWRLKCTIEAQMSICSCFLKFLPLTKDFLCLHCLSVACVCASLFS